MQTDSLEFDPQESQSRYRWWKSSLVWTTLIVTAFLVYEITARPIWGVVVLCSKFGWGDFLTAFWLRRVDRNRPRAKAFFWFLSAIGLLHIANAGAMFSLLFFVLFVVFKIQNRAVLFPGEIYTALGAYCLGIFLSLLAVFLGFWHAIMSRLRLWLPYPPHFPRVSKNENMAEDLLRIAIFVIGLACLELGGWMGGAVDRLGTKPFTVAGILLALIILVSVGLFKLFKALKKRFIAQTPGQCWDADDVVGGVMLSQLPNGRKWRILAATRRISKSEADTQLTGP
jgi:hypothetical protein